MDPQQRLLLEVSWESPGTCAIPVERLPEFPGGGVCRHWVPPITAELEVLQALGAYRSLQRNRNIL